MDELKGCEEKKTLMNSFDKLESKVQRLHELARHSDRLLDKMKRMDDVPRNEHLLKEVQQDPSPIKPDIVDLFNGVSNRLDNLIDRIGKNIEQVMHMID